MTSIFDLKRSKKDLDSANQGLADIRYDEIPPLRNIADDNNNSNFGNGEITWRWSPHLGKWWIPNRSYFKVKFELTKPDGTTVLEKSDNIAVNMAPASCLFQKMQYKINDRVVCEISEHCAQIDALKTRMNKSGRWLKTTGDNYNMWESTFNKRLQKVVANGTLSNDINDYSVLSGVNNMAQTAPSVIDNGNDTIQFDLASGVGVFPNTSAFLFVDNAGNNLRFSSEALNGERTITTKNDQNKLITNLDVGDLLSFRLNGETHFCKIIGFTSVGADNVGDNRIIIKTVESNIPIANIAAASINASYLTTGLNVQKVISHNSTDRQIKQSELIYVPPLSIFNIDHAIPGSSKHEIAMTPFSNGQYQKNFIQSILADKNHGAANDFLLKITEMNFYACMVEGPKMVKDEFYLDLNECRLQMTTVENASRSQYSLDVSPSTNGFVIAFQDSAAETQTLYPQTIFKIRNDQELNLTNLYVRYAGVQKPQPDFRPLYDEDGNQDGLVELYARSQMYNGSYYDNDAETLKEWRDRGMYVYLPYPKTGSDRETRVYTSTEFSTLTEPHRLLLFNLFKKVVILSYNEGFLQELKVNEV